MPKLFLNIYFQMVSVGESLVHTGCDRFKIAFPQCRLKKPSRNDDFSG